MPTLAWACWNPRRTGRMATLVVAMAPTVWDFRNRNYFGLSDRRLTG